MKCDHPGLIQMPAADYHRDEALGHSAILKMLRSPAHFQDHALQSHEATPSMAFGTALHAAILEPETFEALFTVLDETKLEGTLQSLDDYKGAAEVLNIKVGKMKKEELKAAIKAANDPRFIFREDAHAQLYAGKSLLTADKMVAISEIKANIAKHSRASQLLASGHAELSGFWHDPETGVLCKIRPDWLIKDEQGVIVGQLDLKSTLDASITGFSKSIANYGYDVQAAYYTDGLKQILGVELPFYFLAAESERPHNVALYRADAEMIDVGRKKVRAGLMLMKWCMASGQWPGYQAFGDEEFIALPRWAVTGSSAFDMV